MKEEHEEYEIGRMLGGDELRPSLVDLVNVEIQKPEKGKWFGILLLKEKQKSDYAYL